MKLYFLLSNYTPQYEDTKVTYTRTYDNQLHHIKKYEHYTSYKKT